MARRIYNVTHSGLGNIRIINRLGTKNYIWND